MSKLPTPVDSPRTDGRRLRSEASRTRIVQALITLINESGGHGLPSAETVAAKAGVGLRTVFRLFEDMDGLYRGMQGELMQRFLPLIDRPPDPAASPRERLAIMIERRSELYETILPLQVAADSQRHRSPALQEGRARMIRILRETLIQALPPAVRDDSVRLDALELAMSFEAWRRLRMDQHASPEGARAVMNKLVDVLLDGTAG